METFSDILEENTIKSFLRQYPKNEWTEVLTKALKFGIYSMTTIESLSTQGKSPSRKVPLIPPSISTLTPNSLHSHPCQVQNPKSTPKKSKKKHSIKLTPKSKPIQFDFKTNPKPKLRYTSQHKKAKKSLKSLKIPSKNQILSSHLDNPYERTFEIHRSKETLKQKQKQNFPTRRKTESKNETLTFMTSSSSSSLN